MVYEVAVYSTSGRLQDVYQTPSARLAYKLYRGRLRESIHTGFTVTWAVAREAYEDGPRFMGMHIFPR